MLVAVPLKSLVGVPARALLSRTTNGPSAGTRELSTNKTMLGSLDFDKTTAEYAQVFFPAPESYEGSELYARFCWTAQSGSAGQTVQYRARASFVGDGDSLDGDWGTAQLVNDSWIANNYAHWTDLTPGIIPAGTFRYPCLIKMEFFRYVDSDNVDCDAELLAVSALFSENPFVND